MTNKIYSISDADFLDLIRHSTSIVEVCLKLGYSRGGASAYALFNKRCAELQIDWKKELRTNPLHKRNLPLEQVFCQGADVSQETVRRRYFLGQYSEYKCAICGITDWNGKELSLRLDHINGCHNDNRLENLRWICPNCDSQLDTFCGRNLKKRREQQFCVDCGKPLTSRGPVQRCTECHHKRLRRVMERPSPEELTRMLKESSFVQVGKSFGVSDNAIRKWCKAYGLSDKAKDYK